MSCNCILQTGVNVGKACGRKIKANGRCGIHQKSRVSRAVKPKSPVALKEVNARNLKKKADQYYKKPGPFSPARSTPKKSPSRARSPPPMIPKKQATKRPHSQLKQAPPTAEEIQMLYKLMTAPRQQYYSPRDDSEVYYKKGEYNPSKSNYFSLPPSLKNKVEKFLYTAYDRGYSVDSYTPQYVFESVVAKHLDPKYDRAALSFIRRKMCEIRAQKVAMEQERWCNSLK